MLMSEYSRHCHFQFGRYLDGGEHRLGRPPAVQHDVTPTLAAALGVQMPPTTTGRVLPILRTGLARPRVVMLLVLEHAPGLLRSLRRVHANAHRPAPA